MEKFGIELYARVWNAVWFRKPGTPERSAKQGVMDGLMPILEEIDRLRADLDRLKELLKP